MGTFEETNKEIDTEVDTEMIVSEEKEACCHSYLTPKGRCYTCPEEKENDVEETYEREYDEGTSADDTY